MQNKIYLLCDSIQSGKTTTLLKFTKANNNCTGFLSPDINNLRCFLDLERNKIYNFQKTISNAADDIYVGKFIFDNAVFQLAHSIFQQLHLSKKPFIIIDEIGKLEVHNQGFEPALSLFLMNLQLIKNKKIIAVVRDSLLPQVIEKYNLQDAIVLNINEFKTQFAL
jgi:nucleoside-triphosphatase THEP1